MESLSHEQHVRVCALAEVRQLSIGEDLLSDDVIKMAHYIVTGELLEDKYINITHPDAATWFAENVRH